MSGSEQISLFDCPRLVAKKVLAKPQREGDGAVVRRSIGRYKRRLLVCLFPYCLWVFFKSFSWALFVFLPFEFLGSSLCTSWFSQRMNFFLNWSKNDEVMRL